MGSALGAVGLLITPRLSGEFERDENPLGIDPAWVSDALLAVGFLVILAAVVSCSSP